MKDSIAYLPKDKQEELNFLVTEILRRLPQTEFIILYGSYARGNYVRRSIRIEDGGIPTVKISDYDIYVITSGINSKKAEEGRYFYTQIKQEGIILYDSGRYKLSRRRKLNFEEIREQAQEYFDEKCVRANNFLKYAIMADKETDYKEASFFLHQSCENYYYAIRLTHTLRNSKQHNLSKLISSVRRYSDDLNNVFPQNTSEEKRFFKLLKAAYVDARYNPHFVVTKEDIDALIPKVEMLRDITMRICEEKIKEYGNTD